jgi:hydrogenase-4 component B
VTLTLIALATLFLAGLGAAAFGRARVAGHWLGAGGAISGSLIGLAAALSALSEGGRESVRFVGSGYGCVSLCIDPLSAFFLVPIFLLSALAACYGAEYVLPHREHRSLGWHWLWFNVLVLSMAAAVIAANVITFLVAWELMALASFLLVTFESQKASVREAGWVYLVATHLGTALVIAVLLAIGHQAGSFEFDAMAAGASGRNSAVLFVLAVVGFGTKAGFVPLHVWLPEAHPAAPSHVSALMSGVMIKTGIYGLLRAVGFLGSPAEWWGWLLVGVGIVSGVLGVLFALAQHDMKRLLAYHSVENVGIITIGIGLGVVGGATGHPALSVLGYGGALLHVLNHALFKGLLFLAAGSVDKAAKTREIDRLGGLLRRMPWTGATFLVGAIAISGLPPFNGFVSEWLLYLGAFGASRSPAASVSVPALAALAALALIGGLAAACFAKAFGIVFLGERRGEDTSDARDPGWAMRLPMALLALGCTFIGLAAPWVIGQLGGAVELLAPGASSSVALELGRARESAFVITAVLAACLLAVGLLALVRFAWLARRDVRIAVTWDCGYARPTSRMQYTASSFAQPVLRAFWPLVRPRGQGEAPRGYLPVEASLETHIPDLGRERIFEPVFAAIRRALGRVRFLQQGDVHVYVLYVAITLIVLLVWKL